MRDVVDAGRLREFMRALGREAATAGTVYLAGGATAVLIGWRESTVDIDIKLVPDQDAVLRAIPVLKERLSLNVELAAPDDFIPAPEGWIDRSPFVATEGRLTFRHFDLYSQALAKIERGHARDLEDVRAMVQRGLVETTRLRGFFTTIEDRLYKYPAVDPQSFERALNVFLEQLA
jgi:hypothetical protein